MRARVCSCVHVWVGGRRAAPGPQLCAAGEPHLSDVHACRGGQGGARRAGGGGACGRVPMCVLACCRARRVSHISAMCTPAGGGRGVLDGQACACICVCAYACVCVHVCACVCVCVCIVQ